MSAVTDVHRRVHVARMERMLADWSEGRNASPDQRDYVSADV